MAKRSQQFQTIRTEGAILPPDILRRIASLKVDGATPDAYHLTPGSKLNEAISQSWTSLLNHWQAFQEARANQPESEETSTAVTNKYWLLPLFKELDYGRLVTTKSPEIDGRVYPIERFYNHTPIHLIGCKLPLDRRTQGARGAATASPHSMVQEFINRSDEHLWAFLTNGLQLRILRDNISLSRQAFVEFDLEAMMDGEVYADFALLWLLCHQSRVESDKAVDCWLEKWSHLAREQGTRVLNDLRVGVQKAIEALGRGFIGHPRNDRLREKLSTGTLSTGEFYRQLLRTVYRLLFLFVAEDRELLHPTNASAESRNLFDTYYSTHRLRELAHKIRGSKHADLWHSLSLVFDALGRNQGCPELGLCGLGSFLWRASSTADLIGPHEANGEAALISNDDLLQAIRALAYVEQDRMLRGVDYRNLGSEELGSVYESLLELHPVMNADAKAFELSTAAGNERKTTGSYFTPDSLVQCLLDSALDPVVEDRLKGKKGEAAEKAILDMKICDPACGSGHFLIAAAHRLARHLARSRTGEAEPSPDDYQHALRDVIGRCLYGVDINPMAVELCKVSLWMEAIEPGKPLSFLDHHIQCGNSLLGTTPALLAKGIPDDAFQPIEGDEKSVCSDLKKTNKRERADYASGQGYLFSPLFKLGNLPATLARLNKADDDTLPDVTAKESMYAELVKGADYRNARLLADTWCAAFIWKKDKSDLGRLCPTERNFRSIEDNPHSLNIHVKAEVERLSHEYQFFHWHLTFPDVFRLPEEGTNAENDETAWDGGFDIVLGNPPWEKIKLQDAEWFSARVPEIANAANATQRKKLMRALSLENPSLWRDYQDALRYTTSVSHLVRSSGRYFLSARGDLNTYVLFLELVRHLRSHDGSVGYVIPTGIATDNSTQVFFDDLNESHDLVSLFDFSNDEELFPDVRGHQHFCLITLGSRFQKEEGARYAFFLTNTSQLSEPSRSFAMTREEIALLNPNTRTAPLFRNRGDALLMKHLYSRVPVFVNESADVGGDPWHVEYLRMFDMTNDADLFVTSAELQEGVAYTPLFDPKMAQQFNHRAAELSASGHQFRKIAKESTSDMQLRDPYYTPLPLYWVAESDVATRLNSWNKDWMLGFKDVTGVTSTALGVFAIVPRQGAGNAFPILKSDEDAVGHGFLLANLNSLVVEEILRQKINGLHLNYFHLKQIPVLPRMSYEARADSDVTFGNFVLQRVLELTYTSWDLESFAIDCGFNGPPFRWDEERRFLMRCELDAAYFYLYLGRPEEWAADSPELAEMFPTPRAAVDYIMETLPIVKRKDEQAHGEYRTKHLILEVYDEMAEAIRTGQPYRTRLDPPPGPPTDAKGNFIPMAQWDPNNWPSHIHPPRKASEVSK